jgi:preprotein translocase subunit SecA
MTGTAETEESEFHQIYGLEVSVIPTNKPVIRDDRNDLVYKTRREKYNAIVEETQRLHELGFPVLVGTVNVDVSETLSRMFTRSGVKHSVLNAKYHQREAEIVAEAGKQGSVTIATNMAGRGTDIKLGQGVRESKPSTITDPDDKEIEITEMGGLHIVGSERHESRRIDRQLRGRAGRQGDPGASQFFLSLEDDLMRLFRSERIAGLMDRLGAKEGEVLTHPLITRSIEQAQKRVELQNFQSRKRLLEYDDVMNQQREVIYSLRSFALDGGEELRGEALKMLDKAVESRVGKHLELFDNPDEWDFAVVRRDLLMHYLLTVPEFEEDAARPQTEEEVLQYAREAARNAFAAKRESLDRVSDESGAGYSARLLSLVMLNVIDEKWKDHLYDLDQLRNAISYRAWGQKDPLVEYKHEAYNMFVDLMADINNTFAERFLRVQLVFEQPAAPAPKREEPTAAKRRYNALGVLEEIPASQRSAGDGGDGSDGAMDIAPAEPPKKAPVVKPEPTVVGASAGRMAPGAVPVQDWNSVGRNDPCPCGSGKKYKKCHGAS